MAGFIDKMRATEQESYTLTVVGVDPDVHIAGVAMVKAQVPIAGPASGLFRFTYATMSVVRNPSKGDLFNRVLPMVREITKTLDGYNLMPLTFVSAIETAELYADRNQDPAERTAKANALILLSLVAGGVGGVIGEDGPAHFVLPRHWKGNAKKGPTTLATAKALAKCPGVHATDRLKTEAIPVERIVDLVESPFEHALDALGIATYGARQVALGLWTKP